MSNISFCRIVLVALVTGILAVLSCTGTTVGMGGASGTEVSSVSGTVFDTNGNPVPNATVHLRPADFLADSADDAFYLKRHTLLDTISGPDGKFQFEDLMPDSYVVEITIADTLGSMAEFRIDSTHNRESLPHLTVEPMAELTGSIQVNYGSGSIVQVQVYGIDRITTTDAYGKFSLLIPHGKHLFHIGARENIPGSTDEFDHFDLSFEVFAGEQRDAGAFNLRQPPPSPCTDGSCDSAVLRTLLNQYGYAGVPIDSVALVEKGRIVTLNLRGFVLSGWIPFDLNRFSALRELDIGSTGIPGMFPDIGRLQKLEIFKVDGNHCTKFPSTIGTCAMLRELDIHGNDITTLHPAVMHCTGKT